MSERRMAEMPRPKNRYNAQFQYYPWNAFEEGVQELRRLIVRDRWVKLPTQEELEKELDVLIVYDEGWVDIPLTAQRIVEWFRGHSAV